ncbi:hypothetical protein [Streptomyces sp. NPDC058874]|uniref:hypothetical protein n=1 Tax=unclassified Streptomyces TaxID=2593676 RepID=UPI00369223E1
MGNYIAALAVVISLGALLYARRQAVYAGHQLRLAERVSKEANDPYVVVDICPRAGGSGILVFVIENLGKTVARDVEFTIDPPIQGGESPNWDTDIASAVGRRIPFLPPGRRLEWFFTFGGRFYQRTDLPRQYTVTVNAVGPTGAIAPMTYVIDLNVMEGMALDRETVVAKLDQIAKHAEAVSEKLGP